MESYYSEEAIRRFMKPKNFGEIKNADGIGEVGNIKCGDVMKIYLKIKKVKGKDIIEDMRFNTLGCAAAIAISDVICEIAKGKTMEEALKITYNDIVNTLGSLPKIKIHCASLAQEGLKAAIKDYEEKRK